MLEYTKCSAKFNNATDIENFLVDAADDMQGLYLTLSTLGETSGTIEPTQVSMLSDVAGYMSEAMAELRDGFIASPLGANAANRPEGDGDEGRQAIPNSCMACPVTVERLDEILMCICGVSAILDKTDQLDHTEEMIVKEVLMRELNRTMEKIDLLATELTTAQRIES